VKEIKSICFVASGLMGGGTERDMSGLANYYCSRGIKVAILLLFKLDRFYSIDDRIEIYEPDLKRKNMNKYVYALRLIPYIRKILQKTNSDVIFSFGEWFNPFVILATRGLKYPLFVCDRMSPTLKFGLILDNAKKILYKRANGIIAQTNYAADIIRKRTNAGNVAVIPNPLNLMSYSKCEKKNYIVTLGRLSKEKGQKYLIQAFAKINIPDWSLHIVGDGPLRRELEDVAKNLGIEKKVIFHGHRKDFTAIFSESKIFALPSLSEGYPNALIEAMSVPLACISSDCPGGPRDIISNGENGLLVEPRNVAALAGALNELIENETLRNKLSDNAYKIRERLEYEKIAGRYLAFLSSDRKKIQKVNI
jgi:GalNAc-alpha-(1->4)-GalNAc-alpha-(1->3)-diNAcBac-PP-undecaprenol alpha-1,4-N-acetyl-D-galactosaminyltransferase